MSLANSAITLIVCGTVESKKLPPFLCCISMGTALQYLMHVFEFVPPIRSLSALPRCFLSLSVHSLHSATALSTRLSSVGSPNIVCSSFR